MSLRLRARAPIAIAVVVLTTLAAAAAVYAFAFHGRASCDPSNWPNANFDASMWKATDESSRYVYANSLITQLSRPGSSLTRDEVVELLGQPDNERNDTFELVYFVGYTRFCPMSYLSFVEVGFGAGQRNTVRISFD